MYVSALCSLGICKITLRILRIWKLCANLKIVWHQCTILRLHNPFVWYALTLLVRYIRKLCSCSLEIGAQVPDSENAQCNLQIAQIPRLCGTYL